MTVCPIHAQAICLILPSQKAYGFDNGWLHNFLSREYAPSNSIWSIPWSISLENARLRYCIVSQFRILLDTFDQLINDFRRNQEFEVGLLIYIAVLWAPPVDRVR